jgi:hypothetical protein
VRLFPPCLRDPDSRSYGEGVPGQRASSGEEAGASSQPVPDSTVRLLSSAGPDGRVLPAIPERLCAGHRAPPTHDISSDPVTFRFVPGISLT